MGQKVLQNWVEVGHILDDLDKFEKSPPVFSTIMVNFSFFLSNKSEVCLATGKNTEH